MHETREGSGGGLPRPIFQLLAGDLRRSRAERRHEGGEKEAGGGELAGRLLDKQDERRGDSRGLSGRGKQRQVWSPGVAKGVWEPGMQTFSPLMRSHQAFF